jgi:hypothetical protein
MPESEKLQHGGRKRGEVHILESPLKSTAVLLPSFHSTTLKMKKFLFFSPIPVLQYVSAVVLLSIAFCKLLNLSTSFYFPSVLLLRP